MKWRTDKPTADVIVAYVWKSPAKETGGPCILRLAKQPYEYYYDERGYMVAYGAIEKWADLEEDEPVTDCHELEEEIEERIEFYIGEKCEGKWKWDECYNIINDVARHFAKWGAEHLKK